MSGADDATLATAEVQRLSPSADAAASAYLRLQQGHTTTLDVAFTYTHIPAGRFTFEGPAARSPNHVLHLNVRNNDYFQNGIPSVTRSIRETATWLAAVRRALGVSTVRMIGASMGAYAALLFGDMLDADVIYAFSPVLRPAHLALGLKRDFLDISPRLRALVPRTTMTFGAFELGEYQFMLPCLDAGVDVTELRLLANFHPGLLSIRLERLFDSTELPPAGDIIADPHRLQLDRHDVKMLAGLMGAVQQRDHAGVAAVLGPVTRREDHNPGLLYRLGVHQLLAGWPQAARVSFQHACRLLQHLKRTRGIETLGQDADLKKRSVRDYGHLLGFAPLKAVHDLLDGAAA